MLTLETLYALLQGLPAKYLDFLDPPWPPFCQRIENALKQGMNPLAALQFALDAMNDWGRSMLKKALSQVRPVMNLHGLSYRQKEALIALRYAGVASLAQLSRILVQDRSNTRRCLLALVNKGYAVRFFRPGGVYYFAIPSRIEKSIKVSVNELLNKMIDESVSQASVNVPQLPHRP